MNPLRMTPKTMRLAGHRGHSEGAPENTLAAFRMAREFAGPGVTCETDLRITEDGELVLMHDETADRTTDGRGLISKMAYSEVAGLSAGRWFGQEFADERVPLLRDALLFAREHGIIYQLELKAYDIDDVLFPKLRALIDELGAAELLQFSSFDFVQLRALKQAFPEIPTVGLSHSRLIDPAALARDANVDAINIEIHHFPSGETRQLHDGGFAAFLHVPPPSKLKSVRDCGVDIEARVIDWIRGGHLDQLISNDVSQVTRLRDAANA